MADWRIHRVFDDSAVDLLSVQRDMIGELRELGAAFFRVMLFPIGDTHVLGGDILVVEGWRERPDDQCPEPTMDDVTGFGT